MKTGFCLILAMIICLRLPAQVQELQQLKLDLEKLAQFKMMLSEMKQGYRVLQNGYNAVRDAARGNFDLHKGYLDGLLQVSPVVKNDPALSRIFSNQSLLLQEYKASYQRFFSSGLFDAKELADMKGLYLSVMERVSADLDALELVLSPGKLRMSDGERIAVIQKLDANVATQLSAVRVMNGDNERLLVLRLQQKRDMQALRRLNGLK